MASEFAFPLARNARIYAQLSKKRRKTQHFGNGWGQKWIHTETRIRMIADKDGHRKIAYRIKSLGRKLVNFGNALEFLFFDERTDWTASAWEVPTDDDDDNALANGLQGTLFIIVPTNDHRRWRWGRRRRPSFGKSTSSAVQQWLTTAMSLYPETKRVLCELGLGRAGFGDWEDHWAKSAPSGANNQHNDGGRNPGAK